MSTEKSPDNGEMVQAPADGADEARARAEEAAREQIRREQEWIRKTYGSGNAGCGWWGCGE